MTLDAFIRQFTGVSLDFDGVCDAQCVDVAKAWNELGLGYPRIIGNAIDWINRGGSYYDRIMNSPDPNLFPKPGDIVVWGVMPNNNLGHVAVCISANSNSFVSFDQNWGTPKTCRQVTHNYNYVIGWLHPKTSGQPTTSGGGGEPMISDSDAEYGRWNKLFVQIRGRTATRAEFRASAVGHPWLTAMEALSDDAEADQATADQAMGRTARTDNWEGQIKGLNDEVMGLRVKISNQEMQLANLDAETVKLRVEVKNNAEVLKSQEDLINKQTKEIDELNKQMTSMSNQLQKCLSGASDGLVVPTLSSVLESIRLLIKKWLS